MSDANTFSLAGSRMRLLKDKLAGVGVTTGGVLVLVALLLIFFYLLYVVLPIFRPVSVHQEARYPLTGSGKTVWLGMEEQNEVGYRFSDNGDVNFFLTHDVAARKLPAGASLKDVKLPLNGAEISSIGLTSSDTGMIAYGLNNGTAVVVAPSFKVTYPEGNRLITPMLSYPLGEQPLAADEQHQPLLALGFEYNDDGATLVSYTADHRLLLDRYQADQNFITGEIEWTKSSSVIDHRDLSVDSIMLTPNQQLMFVRSGNMIDVYRLQQDEATRLQTLDFRGQANISTMTLLAGASSLLVAQQDGTISQWFEVQQNGQRRFQRIRDFQANGNITHLTPEFSRRSFMATTDKGRLTMFYATSDSELFDAAMTQTSINAVAISPRSSAALLESDNHIHFYSVDNEHPEVTWRSLWGKIWYESYPEPQYVWQSTSGDDQFEPKLSLMPVTFGTIKAAFYAMLFAMPLALAGAVYTAYFMAPKMRSYVKPTIEIMEALPTVILGFLAGLWLAPLVEQHLPGIIVLLVILPIGFIAAAYGIHKLPRSLRQWVPEGWDALLLIPVVLFLGWLSFAVSPLIEQHWLGGDVRHFITHTLGIGFDQRNALVVGLAMGFAVIPTIFSIAEDAVFSVPRHLSNGSLALGATPWQTLTRVVLLTASPGIFSAIMMGLGRAVGETMIVLMASGNTPLMDANIFQGMRTLAANIAVEMPESEVGSSHYRILFLSAFVLFVFTFIVNTLAEFIRQRLRNKYSSM